MYRCVRLQHRADDRRMTSKYHESDLKACGAVIIYRSVSAVCTLDLSRCFDVIQRSFYVCSAAALNDVKYV